MKALSFSSKQLKQFKIDELPTNVVVFASTSQILMSKGDGLKVLNLNMKRIPNKHNSY